MQEASGIAISSVWQVLGPFQIGTREPSWGADPLEVYGGFSSLKYDAERKFPSSLPSNGSAKWTTVSANTADSTAARAVASLTVGYPDVDWPFLQTVYGWAAFQYQAWARGEIVVRDQQPQTVLLFTESILEFRVDGKLYFGGDYYSYRRAPLVLHLEPGTHSIEIRLVRDVRAFGGIGTPTMTVKIDAQLTTSLIDVNTDQNMISDVVDGRLASPFASVVVRNNGRSNIMVSGVSSADTGASVSTLDSGAITILPGQTRPLSLSVALNNPTASSLPFNIKFQIDAQQGGERVAYQVEKSLKLKQKSIYEPHKVTHKHPGGIISYAILRAPAVAARCNQTAAPVLLQFHGAGVEAENDMVAHSLDSVSDICAFVVFPTGVTPWSGDDWHTWGFADVEAAVNSIKDWISYTKWKGIGVDVGKWLVSGHSNGGQGTWYALTHRPDKVFAAAPVSGYLSIQLYVPYHLWQPMEPMKRAVLESSTASYRHELLAGNAKGINILQQHGGLDDNVPTYHSRLMYQALLAANASSTYNELAGKGHWFDGIMTTEVLSAFYREQLRRGQNASLAGLDFEITVPNPGQMGSKAGIKATQLSVPGQLGKIRAQISQTASVYRLETTNVLAIEIDFPQGRPERVSLDGQDTLLTHVRSEYTIGFAKNEKGEWEASDLPLFPSASWVRRGRQLGAMDAILATEGSFSIHSVGDGALDTAIQISRNLFQYFAADSRVTVETAECRDCGGAKNDGTENRISVVVGANVVRLSGPASFPVKVTDGHVRVRDASGNWHDYGSRGGVAAIYLSPLEGERLELVVWGVDAAALAMAARLVPMMTGVGQPDFVILSKSSGWKGAEGALAMGFFDHKWDVSSNSVFA